MARVLFRCPLCYPPVEKPTRSIANAAPQPRHPRTSLPACPASILLLTAAMVASYGTAAPPLYTVPTGRERLAARFSHTSHASSPSPDGHEVLGTWFRYSNERCSG